MTPYYEQDASLIKRFRLAWAFRVWPWRGPANAATYLQWPPTITERDIQRTREINKIHGWDK